MAATLRKKVARVVLACLLALSCFGATSITTLVSVHGDRSAAYAADAWKQSGGRWWYQTGSSYAKGWKQIGGKWYYFDANGWMKTGWVKDANTWYYLGSDGVMKTDWQKVNGTWYYLKKSGAMVTGWNKVGSQWYYHNGSGAMQTGWQKIDGKWYYLTSSGSMAANRWVGNYFLTTSGAMATNSWIGSYWVGSDGAWVPGKVKGTWKKTSGKWWYAKSDSSYAIGWENIDGAWYYFDASGWMKTGWQKVAGKWYYLQGSGAMVTGWNRVSGTWYYHNISGAMLTGWQRVNGAWYYLESSGAMAANKWIGDYYVTSSGAMATNQWIGNYWVGSDGKWDPNANNSSESNNEADASIYLDPSNYPTYGDIDYASGADVYDDAWTLESEGVVKVSSKATAASAKPGDIVVFVPTNENPAGSALRVTSVAVQDGETRIEGTTPELSEVVNSIRATGVTNQFVSLQVADGVTMRDATSSQTLVSKNASYGLFDLDTSGNLTLETFGLDTKVFDRIGLKLYLDPQVYYDIDYRDGELRSCTVIAKVSADLDYNLKIDEQYEAELFSGTIVVPEVPGLTIDMEFFLVTSATGTVQIEGHLTSAAGIVYANGAAQTVSSKGFSYYADFNADVHAGLAPRLGFNMFGFIPLAQVDAEMGVGVEGRMTNHNGFSCADLNAYVYADLYLDRKDEGNVLSKTLEFFKQPIEFHPLTKSNGSVDRIHVENGEIVPKCTWGSGGSGSDQPSGDVIATYDENAGIPELEDNGYGNEPKFGDCPVGASAFGYGNYLIEPFNVYPGQTITIGGVGHKDITYGAYGDPGTVARVIKKDWNGNILEDEINAFGALSSSWYDDTIWTIEVYSGRVVVGDLTGWRPMPVVFGACETIPYPLRISATRLDMLSGQEFLLTSEFEYDDGYYSDRIYFKSSDTSVVKIDRNTGQVKAISKGTATIDVAIPNWKGDYWKRTCTVAVS